MEGTTAGAVAVLDDDLRFLRMVERMLQGHGLRMQPVTTPDPDDAVRVVEQSDASAALIDIYMYGEAAGFSVIDRLRANPATAGIPIIVTSAARREIARNREFLRAARCAVLQKPFGMDDLLCCVDRAIAGEDIASAIVDITSERQPRLPSAGNEYAGA
ncbi:MAG TPA: response regulator [Dehalococcoidia bacterium]|nr:response regulator [Dehalococcoidia bacterium]